MTVCLACGLDSDVNESLCRMRDAVPAERYVWAAETRKVLLATAKGALPGLQIYVSLLVQENSERVCQSVILVFQCERHTIL